MIPISGILKCSYLCSVNQYLVPVINNKTLSCKKCGNKYKINYYAGVTLSDPAKRYKHELHCELNKLDLKLVDYDNNYPLIMSLIFILNNRISQRDLDNLIKLTQDAIYEHLKINDANIYEVHVMKVQSNSNSEFVKFVISQSPRKKDEYRIII